MIRHIHGLVSALINERTSVKMARFHRRFHRHPAEYPNDHRVADVGNSSSVSSQTFLYFLGLQSWFLKEEIVLGRDD